MLSWHQVVIGDTSASGSTATAISGAPYRCAHNRPVLPLKSAGSFSQASERFSKGAAGEAAKFAGRLAR
jgi:hypothetical protein